MNEFIVESFDGRVLKARSELGELPAKTLAYTHFEISRRARELCRDVDYQIFGDDWLALYESTPAPAMEARWRRAADVIKAAMAAPVIKAAA